MILDRLDPSLEDVARETGWEVKPEGACKGDREKFAEVQKKVAAHYSIKLNDMVSHRRAREVARPRQVAMYLAKQLTSRSLPEIGKRFGDRDHTTVLHAVRRIEELRSTDAVKRSEEVNRTSAE